jgi:hypothetical protein
MPPGVFVEWLNGSCTGALGDVPELALKIGCTLAASVVRRRRSYPDADLAIGGQGMRRIDTQAHFAVARDFEWADNFF